MADKVKMSLERYEEMKAEISGLKSQVIDSKFREERLQGLLTKIGIPNDVIESIDPESVDVERLEAVDFSWPGVVKNRYVIKFVVDGRIKK